MFLPKLQSGQLKKHTQTCFIHIVIYTGKL